MIKFNTYEDFILHLKNNNVYFNDEIVGVNIKKSDYFYGSIYDENITTKKEINNYFFKKLIIYIFDKNEYSKRLLEMMNFVEEKNIVMVGITYYILDLKEYYNKVFNIKFIRKQKLKKINS